jgi:predicted dehydrogenase
MTQPHTTPIRVGILGYGFATATFHAPLVASVPGLVLSAVASSQPAKVHADWPGVRVFDTPQALIDSDAIDLVVVPTPNQTHHALAKAALLAGKHVVVDKPFTLTEAEATDLADTAVQQQRLLSVFHNRRWDADFLTLKALLASGVLGRITQFNSHFDRFRPQVRQRWRESANPGSGLWFDLGPHLLDQALQLFGPPGSLSLSLQRQRDGAVADDGFNAVLRYPLGPNGEPNSLCVVLRASALAAHPGPRFVLHGTRGSFIKHGLDPQEDALKTGLRPGSPGWGVDPQPGQLSALPEGAGPDAALQHSTPPHPAGDHSRFYAGVRDAITHGAPNPVPPHEARAVMRWLEHGWLHAHWC